MTVFFPVSQSLLLLTLYLPAFSTTTISVHSPLLLKYQCIGTGNEFGSIVYNAFSTIDADQCQLVTFKCLTP